MSTMFDSVVFDPNVFHISSSTTVGDVAYRVSYGKLRRPDLYNPDAVEACVDALRLPIHHVAIGSLLLLLLAVQRIAQQADADGSRRTGGARPQRPAAPGA
mgnify:CR=1 FL=1